MGNGHWQLKGSAAELYQRYLVPAITTKWAEDLVNRAQPRPEESVLDIACGTGVVARAAAKTARKPESVSVKGAVPVRLDITKIDKVAAAALGTWPHTGHCCPFLLPPNALPTRCSPA